MFFSIKFSFSKFPLFLCNLVPRNPIKSKKCANCHSKLLLHDRFRALRLLGKGAFGRTYLAFDEKKNKEHGYPMFVIICPLVPLLIHIFSVVLKMFFSDFTSEKAIELFRGEGLIMHMT